MGVEHARAGSPSSDKGNMCPYESGTTLHKWYWDGVCTYLELENHADQYGLSIDHLFAPKR